MHRANPTQRSRPTAGFRWTAAFAALTVWVLGLLAGSPLLHASIHGDADQPEHSCAVTLFGQGVEGTTGGDFVTGAPLLFPAGECAIQPALPVAAAPYRLPPGRGPPLR